MFKRIILSLALIVALATPAAAEVTGAYIGLKFIDSFFATGNVSKSDNMKGAGIGSYAQNTVGGGAFVGYDYFPALGLPIRTELEYAIRSNATTNYSGGGNGIHSDFDATWNLQTLFANVYYDFHNSSALTPYVGAGIGIGFVGYDYDAKLSTPGRRDSLSKSETYSVFAWNVGAGCSYAFNEHVSADLAYRFVGLDHHQISETVGDQKLKIGMAPYANEISLGVRFTF